VSALEQAPAQARRPSAKRARLAGVAVSIFAHLAIFLALVSAWKYPPQAVEPEPVTVALVEGPPLAIAPTPPATAPAPPAPDKPPPRRTIVRRAPAPPDIESLPADEVPTVAELGDSDIAGASTADSGPSGGACNMARSLQSALRRDPLVRTAVADAHRAAKPGGKAILVWNGDWDRNSGQDGKGLAAVREAIMWEIAFAPEACRAQPMHGLVLISLNDAPGLPRLAMGSGEWRWSDLLLLRSGGG
jgi:hypothetical protein